MKVFDVISKNDLEQLTRLM